MTAYNVYRARKVEREHPPTGQFITVDGVRLHYLEKGEGPPVVLLHGFSPNSPPLLIEFASVAPHNRPYFTGLPGNSEHAIPFTD